ncbi:MAG: general secretion pathway protein GspK [Gammaproteobacteria bacterium]
MKSKIESRQGGFALVLVLWVLVLLTIMASSFTLSMRREAAVVGHIKDNAQAAAYAEAGIVYTELMLMQDDIEKRWLADGSLYQLSFSGAEIRIQIFDESGKIDVNLADEEALTGVFEAAGVDEDAIVNLIDAILDWRDEDDLERPNGAEKDAYLRNDLNYQPANARFQSLEELKMVLGMDAELYRKVEPVLTIFSGQKGINPAVASKDALLAVPGSDPEQVEEFVFERRESRKNKLPPPEPGLEFKGHATQSGVYTVIAEAMLESGAKCRLKTVMTKSQSSPGAPFSFLEWRQVYRNDESFFTDNMVEQIIN